ncbi:MAG: dienelactone hydrolase family protein [Gammaproteobacteria bacterium]|nr:dienelactone hydrolase family protein [Gammaproteobacteria bacterium]
MVSTTEILNTVELGAADTAQYSVIWLHGLGADGNDFVPIIPELRLPNIEKIHFVFPHAPIRPVSLYGDMPMRAWFDIYNLSESGPFDVTGINEAIASIHQLIQREIDQGIPSEKIILAGFSQGGFIALLSGLFFPERIAGLIGLSTFLWNTPDFEERLQPQNQRTPIYIAHGSADSLLPLKYGEHAATHLKNSGYDVSFHTYPMAHTVCFEEIESLSFWLQKILIF